MTPTIIPVINIKRGDDHSFALNFFLDDDVTPYDLSLIPEIRMQVRIEQNQYSYLIATLTTLDDTLEVQDTNKLVINLNSEVTVKFNKLGIYHYDIKFIDADDEALTPLKGTFNVELNVTQ